MRKVIGVDGTLVAFGGDVQSHRLGNIWAEPFPQGAGVDNWGLGFQLAGEDGRNKRSKGSMTWGGIYNTKFWIDEENGIAAVLLMQYLPFDDEAALSVLGQFEVAIYKNLH